jgi:hypothetical protein
MTSVMTKPAIPTTMSTTPTVDRLIPLTDVVTANFKIAPIAINNKLEPIRISGLTHQVRGQLKATRVQAIRASPAHGRRGNAWRSAESIG